MTIRWLYALMTNIVEASRKWPILVRIQHFTALITIV